MSFLQEPIQSIPSAFKKVCEKYGDAVAMIYYGKKVSFAKTYRHALSIAEFVKQHTVPGDRVALWMPNIPQFAFCYFGILLAGRIAVPINFISIAHDLKNTPVKRIKASQEIIAQFKDAKPALTFMADFFYPIFQTIPLNFPCVVVQTKVHEFLPFFLHLLYPLKARKEGKYAKEFSSDVIPFSDILSVIPSDSFEDISPGETAQLQYTGGTTGIPKGVMLSHRNMVSNVLQIRDHLRDLLEEGKEVILGALPFFHIYGLTACLNVSFLSLGATIVLIPSFDPKFVISQMEKHRVTIFPGVNRMYQALVKSEELKKADLSCLKLCFSGAGPIDREIKEKFKEISGTVVCEGYGLSETSPVVSATLPNEFSENKQGNLIGHVMPQTKVKIVDEKNEEMPSGKVGEIVVSGPQVMEGYWNRKEETERVLCEGWLKTGDTGFLDEKGNLYFTDRVKDVIKVVGENIYASHIEKVLLEHPFVKEAVVVGMENKKTGEIPFALVILRETVEAAESERELKSWVQQKLSFYHVPARIIPVGSLDEFKNPIGKVLKRKVKEFLSQKKELV